MYVGGGRDHEGFCSSSSGVNFNRSSGTGRGAAASRGSGGGGFRGGGRIDGLNKVTKKVLSLTYISNQN
jgi:hypothetical protein